MTFAVRIPVTAARVSRLAIVLAAIAGAAWADEPVVEQEITIMDAAPKPNSPVVDVGPDGAPAVFWQQDGPGGSIICLQRLAASGEKRTDPLLANDSLGFAGQPTGRVLPDGTLFVFWRLVEGDAVKTPDGRVVMAAAQGSSVLGRRFDPNGQPIGGEIVVSQGNSAESNRPASATDVDGETVVVWEDGGDIQARVYDESGAALTPVRTVSDRFAGGALAPSVAKAPSGEVVVSWRQTDGGQRGIFVRVLNRRLQAFAKSTQVTNLVNASATALAIDRNGGVAVAWEENGVEGRDVFVRRLGRRGQLRGPAVPINSTTAGDQGRPKLDFDAAGRLVVAWESSVTPLAVAGVPGAAVAQGGSVLGRVFNPDLGATSEEFVVAETENGEEPAAPVVSIDDQGRATVVFQKESTADQTSKGLFRKRVRLPSGGACSANDQRVCLNGGRFRVEVEFDPPTGPVAKAGAVPLTGDTGTFWFFDRDNVEIVTKVLETCAINGHRWVFAAGLTDLPSTVRVTDAATGAVFEIDHPGGPFAPVLDIDAFACGPAATAAPQEATVVTDPLAAISAELALLDAQRAESSPRAESFAAAECDPSETALCLNESRFEVEASFRRPGSGFQPAETVKLTGDTGYFWFFDEANVEIVAKVLDGCSLNGHYWVFAGGLTDVEVELVVRDSASGKSVTYRSPQGQPFAPIRDTEAIAACP